MANKHFIVFGNPADGNIFHFDGTNLLYPIALKENENLVKFKDLDMAVNYCYFPAKVNVSSDRAIRLTNLNGYPKSWMLKKEELYSGMEITFIGFPNGIGADLGYVGKLSWSDIKTNPLVRRGIVSWVSDYSDLCLLDGISYGGNSGSPIFAIPTISQIPKFVGIAFDSGFNSKTTFNRTFKEFTGKTPAAYKQSLQTGAIM